MILEQLKEKSRLQEKNVGVPPLSILLSKDIVNEDPSSEKTALLSTGAAGSWSALRTTNESIFMLPLGYAIEYSCAEGPVNLIEYQ